MSDSHLDEEPQASFDPSFAASFKSSFQVDYFAKADEPDLSEPSKQEDKIKEAESMAKKLDDVFGKTEAPSGSKKQEEEDKQKDNESDGSDFDHLLDMNPRKRAEKVFTVPPTNPTKEIAPQNPKPKPETSKKEKAMSYLETKPKSSLHTKTFMESTNLMEKMNPDVTKSMALTNANISKLDKSKWTDDLKCYVCSRVFNKVDMIFTHHCRICGRSVCGECSTKKINDDRACDVCFYKATHFFGEEMRNGMLKEKKKQIHSYKRQLEEAAKKLGALNEKKKDAEKMLFDEQGKHEASANVLMKEKEKREEALQKTKDENQKLKESITETMQFVHKKEAETREIQLVLNVIKNSLVEKTGKWTSKKEEADKLVAQKQSYNYSVLSNLDPDLQSNSSFYRSPAFYDSCGPTLPGSEDNESERKSPNRRRNF